MKFSVREKTRKNFTLLYGNSEFYIEPNLEPGYGAITVNYLHLELDEEGRIMYVYGYTPLNIHQETQKFPEQYERKDLIALLDAEPNQDLAPGNPTYKLVKDSHWPHALEWPVYVNRNKGWVCLGAPIISGKRMIEFAPNCVAALDNQSEMVAIWLCPKQLPHFLSPITKGGP